MIDQTYKLINFISLYLPNEIRIGSDKPIIESITNTTLVRVHYELMHCLLSKSLENNAAKDEHIGREVDNILTLMARVIDDDMPAVSEWKSASDVATKLVLKEEEHEEDGMKRIDIFLIIMVMASARIIADDNAEGATELFIRAFLATVIIPYAGYTSWGRGKIKYLDDFLEETLGAGVGSSMSSVLGAVDAIKAVSINVIEIDKKLRFLLNQAQNT